MRRSRRSASASGRQAPDTEARFRRWAGDRALAGFVSLLPCAACSSESTLPLPYSLSHRPVLPFPTDEMLRSDPSTATGLRVALSEEGSNLGDVDESIFLFGPDFANALARADGWSTLGPVFAPVSAEVDPGSLDDHVLLVDIERRTIVPTKTRTFGGPTRYERETHWVTARSALPLRPKAVHAIVLTYGLRSATGERFERPRDFDRLFRGGSPDAVEGAPERVQRAISRLEGLRDALRETGLSPDEVLVADTFTTQSIEEETNVLAGAYRSSPPPEITLDGDGDGLANVYDPPTADPRFEGPESGDYSSIRALVRAEFQAPNFRRELDGPMVVDATRAALQSWERIEALMTIPIGAGPFPLVLYQHGVGDQKESLWRWANELAERGFALIGFDAPLHGFRTDRPRSAATQFINIVDPSVVVDNFRQAETEHVYFMRAIHALASIDIFGDGSRTIDPERVFWMGNSLGSMIGAVSIGLEPRFAGAALAVGGGTMLEFFERVLGGFSLGQFPAELFTQVAQTALDKGDPTNYAHLSRDTQILFMQGMEDETIPRAASASLARAMDLPQLEPVHEADPGVPQVIGPLQRRAWTQFEPATHALIWAPDRTPESYARARAQMYHFLVTCAETGVGEIR